MLAKLGRRLTLDRNGGEGGEGMEKNEEDEGEEEEEEELSIIL